jgi:hypothetical protein
MAERHTRQCRDSDFRCRSELRERVIEADARSLPRFFVRHAHAAEHAPDRGDRLSQRAIHRDIVLFDRGLRQRALACHLVLGIRLIRTTLTVSVAHELLVNPMRVRRAGYATKSLLKSCSTRVLSST